MRSNGGENDGKINAHRHTGHGVITATQVHGGKGENEVVHRLMQGLSTHAVDITMARFEPWA
jgi:hypothetical protein